MSGGDGQWAREPRVRVGIFRMILATACALGGERGALLAAAGVAEADLIDPDGSVPLSAQVVVGQYVLAAGAPVGGITPLAMRHFALPALGVLGYALAHSATVGDALAVFVRYQRAVTDAATFRLRGATVEVSAHPALMALKLPVEGMLGLVTRLVRGLGTTEAVVKTVEFVHAAPADPGPLTRLFGVTPRFDADGSRITFDPAALEAAVDGANIALQPALLALLDANAAVAERGPFATEVIGALRACLPRGDADKATVARHLGVSPRTLARRLAAEKTGFRALLDDVRQELACHWLADDRLAIYEVAFMLGYSESGAFHRAFRRWTGRGPAEFRAA